MDEGRQKMERPRVMDLGGENRMGGGGGRGGEGRGRRNGGGWRRRGRQSPIHHKPDK